MNKILAIIVVILVLAGVIWAYKTKSLTLRGGDNTPGTSTPVVTIETYKDPQGVFQFQYPSFFTVSGRQGSMLALVKVPREYMPGTNFSEANLTISSTGPGTNAICDSTTISSEAAAGNRYETTVTKKLYDGDCYNFEYIIHYTNIQNYDPNQGVKEFNKSKIESDLNGIIKTFKYLVNSD